MKQVMIKAVATFLFSLYFISNADAQTGKGDWLIGGILELNTAKNSSTFEFSPNAGYFIIDNLAIGAKLIYSYDKLGDLKINSFGVGPFVRYYFTESNIKPFFAGDFDFQNQKISTGFGSSTENAFNYFLGGGAAIFINENVAVEGLIGYRHTKVKEEEGNGGLNLRVGFQVYINHGQVNNMKSKLTK